MTREKVLSTLQDLLRDQLDNDSIWLSEETTSNDVDNWDSLTNIMLVVAIERHFKIKLSSSEILAWKNVGEMCDSILLKI